MQWGSQACERKVRHHGSRLANRSCPSRRVTSSDVYGSAADSSRPVALPLGGFIGVAATKNHDASPDCDATCA
eukprot:scaffold104738_cov33-Tisochrysis_lutea.AAC.2